MTWTPKMKSPSAKISPSLILIAVSLLPSPCLAIEPFSAGLAVGAGMFVSALWSSRDKVVCQLTECCGGSWINPNVTLLAEKLHQNLFGQHLVTSLVTRAVRAHTRKNDPKKALVMSFHGWTGSGKNFVAKFIVESLYKLGMSSKYVHLFISTLHFPNQEQSDIYKLNIQDWIRGSRWWVFIQYEQKLHLLYSSLQLQCQSKWIAWFYYVKVGNSFCLTL